MPLNASQFSPQGPGVDYDPHWYRRAVFYEVLVRAFADGNGDGVIDPQNLFDAALTTGKYLCDGSLDRRDLAQQTKAILRYNNSMAYVANVMAWSVGYSTGIVPAAEALPRIH